MSVNQSLAEFEIGSGAQRGSRLTLYASRLVHQGKDAMETVPLAQLASVRVAFERDARKLNWAVALLIAALVLVLLASFAAIGSLARLLFPLAGVLAAIAVALLVFFWLGHTTLTLSFAATERAFAVTGRNPFLVQFAEAVADQLAALRD